MDPKWHFLPQTAMTPPADQMANPLSHTALTDAELLMREAIQNSADERKTDADGPVRFSVRRKQYRGDEKSVLVGKFRLEEIAERAKSFKKAHGWFKFNETCLGRLHDPDVPISALLLSDHNTNGLGGDWQTADGVNSRFHNLVLSIYTSHKQEDGTGLLGSYGVGKMVYAVASKIRTMAYYSCFDPDKSTEGASARFMATAFLQGHRTDGQDYTGHAFFGNSSETNYSPARPLIDANAHEFAECVGLERRSSDDTGLTVMLLDCDLTPQDCLDACEKFWWPRTFDKHSETYVDLEFFDGDTKLPSPNPIGRPELKPFIDCFSNIRQGVKPEGYENKKVKLRTHGDVGHLCLKALSGIEGLEALLNELANTVALIRSGLVIQYNPKYVRPGLDAMMSFDEAVVGVFEATGEYPEKCFTMSEPAAHDKWNSNDSRLHMSLGDDGVDLVRLTHSRVKENVRDFQTRIKEVVRKPTSEGLEFLDDILGPIIFRKRKKGPPPRPKPAQRAFTVHKKGWRDPESEPIVDYLDFTIALAEGVSQEPVPCRVKAVLRILEDADARPGTAVSCTVLDDDGKLMSNGSGTFEVELAPDVAMKFRASAQVHPTWRTRWAVTVMRKAPTSPAGEDA